MKPIHIFISSVQKEFAELYMDELKQCVEKIGTRNQVLNPLIETGLLEMTVPDEPRSSKQKYRLTGKGQKVVEGQRKGDGKNE